MIVGFLAGHRYCMVSTMEHGNQHWIPRGYISAWCDPDPGKQNPCRVYRYGKDGRYIDYRTPKRIFSDVPELYTKWLPDGGRDLSTEHALQRLEDAYIRMRDRLLTKRQPLTDEARADLFLFISALRARSPSMRDHHAENDAAVLRVADSVKASMQQMTPEQRRNLPRPLTSSGSGIPLEEFRRLAARPFGETLLNQIGIEARLLGRMHLSILVVLPGGESLISSDNPVSWWDPFDPPPSRRPLGLGRDNIEVTLPISPTTCAIATHEPGEDYIDIGADAVDELNMRTLYRCREVFISERRTLGVVWHPPSPG